MLTVVSRVGRQKRPAFIDLSRCHGSARGTRRTACVLASLRYMREAGPAFAGKLPSSLRFDATSPQYKLAGQAGAASGDQSCFDMWANIPIMSHINLRKFFGRWLVFNQFCLCTALRRVSWIFDKEAFVTVFHGNISNRMAKPGCAVRIQGVEWRVSRGCGGLRRGRCL